MTSVHEKTPQVAADAQEDAPALRLIDLCPKYDKPWWRVPHLLLLNLKLTIPLMTGYLIGFDSSMLNGIQSVPVWKEDFDHPAGAYLGLLATMHTIGAVTTLPIAPYLSDRLGRRYPVVIGSLFCLLGTGVQAGAPNKAAFLVGRYFLGVGGGIVGNATAPLLAELSYPSHRAFLTAFASTSWYVGAIVAAWATFGTFKMDSSWSWRIPSVLQGLPSIYQLAFIYFVPESPRWLIANGRRSKARRDLNKYHAGIENDSESSPLVEHELAEIETAIELEKQQNTRSYLDFFSTKGNMHRLAIIILIGLMGQWAGNGLVSYLVLVLEGIGIKSAYTQNLINGGLQLYNYATAIIGSLIIMRFRRRTLMLSGCALMIVAFTLWTILSSLNEQRNYDSKLGVGVVVMIFVYFIGYNLGWSPIFAAYIMEVLPFTLRAKGYMIMQTATYGAGLFNGFANPIALDAIQWKYYIVYCVLLCVWFATIYFLFPETSGLTLEEVSEIFDKVDISGAALGRAVRKGPQDAGVEDARAEHA